MEMDRDLPVINCHAHIFTHEHVPKYLGKKLIPFPLWLIATTALLIKVVYIRLNFTKVMKKHALTNVFYTLFKRLPFFFNRVTQHTQLGYIISRFISTTLTILSLLFLLNHFRGLTAAIPFVGHWLIKQLDAGMFTVIVNWPVPVKWVILIVGLLLIDSGRNFLLFMLRQLKYIPGPATFKFLERYISIGAFSEQKTQEAIFNKLRTYYPETTRFVILPMDMDYMKAGKAKEPYMVQLEKLKHIKKTFAYKEQILPFVFADPRRIAEDSSYYNTIIDLLENHKFTGIKIYPAEGYYPFDKNLLKLFLYCCSGKRKIPITTHCIRGIIFYRGLKKADWDYHPIFTEQGRSMPLRDFKNVDFINNFTHPLNYVCLLEPLFLARVLDYYNDKELNTLFGYNKESSLLPVKDLRELKLCFGHFGGEDEWNRFLTNDLNEEDNPKTYGLGQNFNFTAERMDTFWKSTSWFTIVRNCLLKYPNTYADISFTLYDDNIITLLKDCLRTPVLQDKILYGTDFYVVRQKKSDKEMWIDILSELNEEELYRLAKKNPDTFIN